MRLLIPLLMLACVMPLSAQAACIGTNQIDALPAADRAALVAAADAAPYSRGNLWQARRGDRVITLFGTFHAGDPRNDALMTRLTPLIAAAGIVLVEAGPDEQASLKDAIAQDPSLMFTAEGPTLRESLPADLWARIKEVLRRLGIPPFLAAKMQPAYLAMLLGIPACVAEDLAAGGLGLDARIIAEAAARDIPVRALESFDTLFGILKAMGAEDQRRLLELTLAMTGQAEDAIVTLTDAYFAGQPRLIWEFSRWQAMAGSALPPDVIAADFARMEEALLLSRNRAWIPVIEAATVHGSVFVAFGALHLSGQDGVLNLLARAGYAVTPLPP